LPTQPEAGRAARVPLRNGPHGYGIVTKALHWLTVVAILGQFLIGYLMDFDEEADRAEDRLDAEAERLEEDAEARGEGAEARSEAEIERRESALESNDEPSSVFVDVVSGDAFSDGFSLAEAHVSLGLFVILLAATRILWRRTTPLPPWAEHLNERERRLESRLEKLLLSLLVIVPATGLLLIATDDDWLAVHVAAQIAFLVTVAAHVGLVLRHTLVRRNRHLARMI
jgi:cytochrome b561